PTLHRVRGAHLADRRPARARPPPARRVARAPEGERRHRCGGRRRRNPFRAPPRAPPPAPDRPERRPAPHPPPPPARAPRAALHHNRLVPETALAVETSSIIRAALLGLVAAVLAAVLPAWRASRVAPVATLRCQGTEQPAAVPGAGASQLPLAATVIVVGAACTLQAVARSAAPGIVATNLIAIATALAARPALGLLRGLGRLPAAGPAAWFAVR